MFYLNVIIIIIILVFLFFFYLWNFFPVTRFLVTPLLVTRYSVTLFSNTPFKYSFFVRIIKEWNNLPNHLFGHDINDISVNRLKPSLKKWMNIH